jgi:HAD superfamily hydrolase (TIGR01509 family)
MAEAAVVPEDPNWRGIVRETIADAIMPEVSQALAGLAETGPVWMLSNQYGPWLRDALASRDITNYLERIFVSSEIRTIKPRAESFQVVLDAWAGQPERVLFIDDKQGNLDAAATLGMSTFLSKDDVEVWSRAAEQFRAQ